MKTKMTVALLGIFFSFSARLSNAQTIACPYPVANQAGCSVVVNVEFLCNGVACVAGTSQTLSAQGSPGDVQSWSCTCGTGCGTITVKVCVGTSCVTAPPPGSVPITLTCGSFTLDVAAGGAGIIP